MSCSSDGAGEAVAVGPKVRLFKTGQRVTPTCFQNFHAGTLTSEQAKKILGGNIDGVMSEYRVFNENGLVEIPLSFSYRGAATLPCAGLTAWNAMYGGNAFRPGHTVLTQGMGGVSMFAVQFALAGGAQVIATTSSGAKWDYLNKLGVHHVINYKEDEEWGQTAKKLSIGQRGADYIFEIGWPNTFAQSSVAAEIEGTVAVIGTRGGKSQSGSSSTTPTYFHHAIS
jgi:NADPH:quinone reductase-like Zn-dependent oxidoreductase